MSVCSIHRQDRKSHREEIIPFPFFHSPISAFIVWSLLCGVLFHLNCYLFWVKCFILIKLVYGTLKLLSKGIFQAVLAAESAWSFPLIPMWLGIQHSSISLAFDRNSILFNICMIKGLSRFWFFRNVSTDKESEKNDEFGGFSLSYNVECQIYGFSFCTVDRSAVRKLFCYLGIMLDDRT